jgi:hypothetical protein
VKNRTTHCSIAARGQLHAARAGLEAHKARSTHLEFDIRKQIGVSHLRGGILRRRQHSTSKLAPGNVSREQNGLSRLWDKSDSFASGCSKAGGNVASPCHLP